MIGVDMTPEMLRRARASAAKMGIKNVEFREGYLESLPVDEGSVDVVISNCVINLSPDKPRFSARSSGCLNRAAGWLFQISLLTERCLKLSKRICKPGERVAGALDMKEYTLGLEEAGFINVKVQPKDGSGNPFPVLPVGEPFSATITAQKPN